MVDRFAKLKETVPLIGAIDGLYSKIGGSWEEKNLKIELKQVWSVVFFKCNRQPFKSRIEVATKRIPYALIANAS